MVSDKNRPKLADVDTSFHKTTCDAIARIYAARPGTDVAGLVLIAPAPYAACSTCDFQLICPAAEK